MVDSNRNSGIPIWPMSRFTPELTRDDHRPIKATRATIAKLAGALIIEASAEEVDASLVDGQGFYGRKAETNGR
jgi:hypothetical protein